MLLVPKDPVPIYEFRCKQCGHRFERMQKFTDPHPTECPDCGAKDAIEALLSAPAVQFKGSGFYSTDYARKSSGPSAENTGEKKKEVKTESGSSKTTETKSESKSEPKSESKKSDSSDRK